MNIFFTSDTHFGHDRIIELSKRPFKTVEEMDETLISNWNAIIGPRDTVYHLGDFSFRKPGPYLDRLNGDLHLVYGNHDDASMKHFRRRDGIHRNFKTAQHYKEISLPVRDVGNKMIAVPKVKVILFHFAMRVWHNSHRGSLQLYGHSHGDLPPHGNSFDVGVDAHGFKPLSWLMVQQIACGLDRVPAHSQEWMHHDFCARNSAEEYVASNDGVVGSNPTGCTK